MFGKEDKAKEQIEPQPSPVGNLFDMMLRRQKQQKRQDQVGDDLRRQFEPRWRD